MENENVLRKKYEIPFVQVPREITNHPSLSWKAKGLMAYLLDKPDNWKFSIAGIASQGKENETAVSSGLKELKNFGYLRIKKIKNPITKRFTGYEWEITAFSNNFSVTGFSEPGISEPGKSGTSNTQDLSDLKKESKEDATSSDAYALCDFLLQEIQKNKSDFTGKITTSWLKCASTLLKIRTSQQLKDVIVFAVNDSISGPWTNCMTKIKKHLDSHESRMRMPIKTMKPSSIAQQNKELVQKAKLKYNLIPYRQQMEIFEDHVLLSMIFEEDIGTYKENSRLKNVRIEFIDVEFRKHFLSCLTSMKLNTEGL